MPSDGDLPRNNFCGLRTFGDSPLPPQCWFTAAEALSYLRCDGLRLAALIREGRLHAYRAPALGLLFRREELDAAPAPLGVEEALRQLANEITPTSASPDMPSTPATPGTSDSDTHPLKKAAVILNLPYKTLLRLASEGAIPAIDLNAHRGRQRPRFVVSISAVQQHLKNQSEKQAVMRRSQPQGIDLARLAQPQRGVR